MKLRLITNLDFLTLPGDLRIDCHALILEFDPKLTLGQPTRRIRGFKMDATDPVFTRWFGDTPFVNSITRVEDSSYRIVQGEKLTPIFVGTRFQFVDGFTFVAQHCDTALSLDVTDWKDYSDCWRALELKVRAYWQYPNIPIRTYVPTPPRRIA